MYISFTQLLFNVWFITILITFPIARRIKLTHINNCEPKCHVDNITHNKEYTTTHRYPLVVYQLVNEVHVKQQLQRSTCSAQQLADNAQQTPEDKMYVQQIAPCYNEKLLLLQWRSQFSIRSHDELIRTYFRKQYNYNTCSMGRNVV